MADAMMSWSNVHVLRFGRVRTGQGMHLGLGVNCKCKGRQALLRRSLSQAPLASAGNNPRTSGLGHVLTVLSSSLR